MSLRETMFTTLQRLPHSFYSRAKVGDLISRLTGDLEILEITVGQVLGVGVYLVLMTLAAGVTLLVLSPLLGAVVLIVVPLFGVAYFVLRSRLQEASYEQQELTGQLMASVQENLSAHALVKAFGLETSSIQIFRGRLESLFRVALRLTVIGALFETSFTLAGTFGQLVVIGVGGWLVIDGHLTIGTLVAFIGLLPSLFQPIAVLSSVGKVIQSAAGSFERVAELLEEPEVVTDKPDAHELPDVSRELRLEHVTFGYTDDRPVLTDVSVSIPAARHTAVVGPSGSGKSTLVSLLLRFWDPQQGRILADDHDLRDVTRASLRGQIGLVFQETFVFDSTLRENIAIGRPEASDEEVVAAARAAELEDFVAGLPAGYDTVLGERGVRMSGGQRQRLAIARALLKNSPILILDEATSSLDAESELLVQDALANLMRNRTAFVIAHRLSTVRRADAIIALERGRVAEKGRHDELLARAGGVYAKLYALQLFDQRREPAQAVGTGHDD
jgi:ABC-type multidrug transport system fused ATPase/permease subunit